MNDESRVQLKHIKREEAVKEIEKFRKTNSGKFVLRMYKEFRKNKTL